MGLFYGADKRRCEQLYECVLVVGESLLDDITSRDLLTELNPMLAMTMHAPDAAFRLGYVIVASAYTLRDGARPRALKLLATWIREVMRRQQLASHKRMSDTMMRGMAAQGHKTLPYMPPTPSERKPMLDLVNLHWETEEKSIKAIVEGVRANQAHPFESAYGDLVPYFGGPGGPEEYEERYGALLSRLLAEARNAVAAV